MRVYGLRIRVSGAPKRRDVSDAPTENWLFERHVTDVCFKEARGPFVSGRCGTCLVEFQYHSGSRRCKEKECEQASLTLPSPNLTWNLK